MIIHNVEQLSPEWWELRCGIPTASEFKRIITAKDGKPSKGMAGYAAELASDVISHNPNYFSIKGKPTNVHMERGRDLEAEALEWYSFAYKVEIERVGFVTTDDKRFGCSPDAFTKVNGVRKKGLEVKCPEAKKHAKHVLKATLPLDYKAQCHGGLCVTDLEGWVLIEYCPLMTPLVVDIEPDSFTAAMRVQMEAFDKLYQEVKAKLGVTKVEETKDPRVEQAIQAWKEKLAEGPGIATLNEWLEEMKDLPQASKKSIWEAVKAYGATKGWTFDYTEKVWKEPAPV